MGKKTKQTGKTEVYPFWYMKDIKNMMDYFKMKKMWHWYLVFNFGLLLGRRVSDTLSFKWSDFFYENSRMKDEIEIKEQKTGKVTRPYVCGACKEALQLYIDKAEINPIDNYNDFIITTPQKSHLLENREEYTEEEYQEGLKGLAEEYGAESPEAFEEQYGREAIEDGLLYDKTVDFVVGQAVEI